MNARELHDKLEYEHKAGLRWLFSSDAQERETVLRALRLLAAAEGGEGTPETDAEVSGIRPWDRDGVLVVGWDDYCALRNRRGLHERERNALAKSLADYDKLTQCFRLENVVLENGDLRKRLAECQEERERFLEMLRGYRKAVNGVAPHFDKPITDENIVHWLNFNNAGATIDAAIDAARGNKP